ncbi:MAG TPA: prenyltransferase/squalene oxidase repeat-containing protein, partial [Pirellulales bacterium]|nr:prenyltransferase/squalene oxidase repeat-containing protein [Pirellulales bacterium]
MASPDSGALDSAQRAAFDPYYRWLGIPQAEQPPTLYRLLGLSPLEPDLDVIEEAADRQMAHVRVHQNGAHSAESQRLLNELAAAKRTLLHVGKKLAYDRTLRPPVPPPPAPGAVRPSAPVAAPMPRPVPISAPRAIPAPAPVPLGAHAVAAVPGNVNAAPGNGSDVLGNGSAARASDPPAQPGADHRWANAPRSPEIAPTRAPGVAAVAPAPARPRPVPVPVAVKADPSKLVLRETPADPDEDLKRFALKKAPPWAVSCIVHMLLLIILGLWYIAPESIHNGIFLDVASPELGQQLIDDSIDLPMAEVDLDEAVVTPTDLAKVEDPFAEPKTEKVEVALLGSKPIVEFDEPKIELALEGRQKGMKELLLNKYGGNGESNDAVALALKWLAKQQRKDGGWSLKGPYTSGAMGGDIPESATAMALLAFQGDGNTHKDGPFQKQVAKGIYALLRMQGANGDFFQEGGRTNNWFYAHAQATMAVCELYGMTKDQDLREPATRAIQFLIESQDPNLGGWRYMPKSDS